MELSIIIVNFNSAGLLLRCLQSIQTYLAGIPHEVCVVDNASSDPSVRVVRRSFPGCRVITHKRNRGFAAAVNTGLKNTQGRYVMWLNPDTELLNAGAGELIRHMTESADVGVVGPQLVDPDRSVQLSCRSFPSYSTALFHRYSLLTRWLPSNYYSRHYLHTGWDHASARRVDWVSGACLMHRRAVTDRIGGLDERYFLYGEDVDFCRQAHQAGWQVHYHPALRVMHHIGGSSRLVPRHAIVERHRSMWRYYTKHFSRNLLKDALVGTGITARCLWTMLRQNFNGNGHHEPKAPTR